jgi:hypothetical protein
VQMARPGPASAGTQPVRMRKCILGYEQEGQGRVQRQGMRCAGLGEACQGVLGQPHSMVPPKWWSCVVAGRCCCLPPSVCVCSKHGCWVQFCIEPARSREKGGERCMKAAWGMKGREMELSSHAAIPLKCTGEAIGGTEQSWGGMLIPAHSCLSRTAVM